MNRLLLVCAVLTRRVGMPLSNQDVIVNVAGGLRVDEPAADLGMALAIASSLRNVAVDPELAAIGEVGLSGEVRRVPQLDRRIREAVRLGLKRCLVPSGAAAEWDLKKGLEAVPVRTLAEAVKACIPRPTSGYDGARI
jgi:DNA repair protein RadA/Sms